MLKSLTVKILSAKANINLMKTTSVNCIPPALKKKFGGKTVCEEAGFEETYLYIKKDLILKSIKIIS